MIHSNSDLVIILRLIVSLPHKTIWFDAVQYIPSCGKPKVSVKWITKEKASILIQNLKLNWMKDDGFFVLPQVLV